MTNKKFKEIKTNMISFEKVFQPTSGKIVGIIINDIRYHQGRTADKLTRNQLEYFEFLDDFKIENPITLKGGIK